MSLEELLKLLLWFEANSNEPIPIKSGAFLEKIEDLQKEIAGGGPLLPKDIVDRLAGGENPVRVLRETPVSALVDGGNQLGYVAAYRGAEIAVAKARTSGIAIVGVNNSYYSGRNAYYVERIVRAGLVAIHAASAKPHVLPPGGLRPALAGAADR